jgi:hypothetical protein
MNKRQFMILGLSLAMIGALLAASFQFVYDHRWYWNVAPLICVVVMLAAAFGGFCLGRGLSRTRNRRLWLIVLGGFLVFAWIGTGALATSLSALGMFYLPGVDGHIGWDSYSGTHLFTGSHIRFLQFATATGFVGGLSIGFGLAQKRILARSLLDI